jgi:hypothetical protein
VPLDQEVDDEIAFHIEMRTRELVDRGVDPRIAREMVLARIGDATRLKRTCLDLGRKREREMRLTQWLEEFREDVRFAIRQLRMSPGFTLVATITLALGIGASSAMFALADAALVRPLPFPEPGRLAVLSELFQGQPGGPVNPVDFVEWTERARSFTAIAAVVRGPKRWTKRSPSLSRCGRVSWSRREWIHELHGRWYWRASEIPFDCSARALTLEESETGRCD